jgi:hypothetical protein
MQELKQLFAFVQSFKRRGIVICNGCVESTVIRASLLQSANRQASERCAATRLQSAGRDGLVVDVFLRMIFSGVGVSHGRAGLRRSRIHQPVRADVAG